MTAIPASSGMTVPEDIEPWLVLDDCDGRPGEAEVSLFSSGSTTALTTVSVPLPGADEPQVVEVPFPALPVAAGSYELRVGDERLDFVVEAVPAAELEGSPEILRVYDASHAHGETWMALDFQPVPFEPGFGGVEVRRDGRSLAAAGLASADAMGHTFRVPDAEVGDEVCVEVVQRDAAGREASSAPVCSEVRWSAGCSTAGGGAGMGWIAGILLLVRRRDGPVPKGGRSPTLTRHRS